MTDQLRRIPDDLLRRDAKQDNDRRRAVELLAHLEARGIRPTWLDLHHERQRRGFSTRPGPSTSRRQRRGLPDHPAHTHAESVTL